MTDVAPSADEPERAQILVGLVDSLDCVVIWLLVKLVSAGNEPSDLVERLVRQGRKAVGGGRAGGREQTERASSGQTRLLPGEEAVQSIQRRAYLAWIVDMVYGNGVRGEGGGEVDRGSRFKRELAPSRVIPPLSGPDFASASPSFVPSRSLAVPTH